MKNEHIKQSKIIAPSAVAFVRAFMSPVLVAASDDLGFCRRPAASESIADLQLSSEALSSASS